jgi:predicted DNA-binding transcriptional regulator AlpA
MTYGHGLYSLRDQERLTTLHRCTIWRMIGRREFPAGVRISRGRMGWFKWKVHRWLMRKLRSAEERRHLLRLILEMDRGDR